MDSIGYRIIEKVVTLAEQYSLEDKVIIYELLRPYFLKPDDMDLRTICKLEAFLKTELLIVPTKQQWRKIKLEKLNNIIDGS